MKVNDIEFYGVKVEFPKDMVDFWRFGFPEEEGWRLHLDHCTLGHCSNMTVENLLQAYMNREEECELVIDAVGHYTLPGNRGEVLAFRVKGNRITVDDYPMRGETRHFILRLLLEEKLGPKIPT